MEKERKIKTLSLAALIVAVLGLTVAFASLSQVLTINGTTTAKGGTWDIHFKSTDGTAENTITPELSGAAKVEGTAKLTNTTINDISITLTKPGDKVVYKFDVENSGTIDAKIGTFNKNVAKCTSNAEKEGDATLVCSKLIYKLTYDTENGTEVKDNDVLNKNEKKHLVLTIGYDQESEAIPEDDVTIDIPNISINYVQN